MTNADCSFEATLVGQTAPPAPDGVKRVWSSPVVILGSVDQSDGGVAAVIPESQTDGLGNHGTVAS